MRIISNFDTLDTNGEKLANYIYMLVEAFFYFSLKL